MQLRRDLNEDLWSRVGHTPLAWGQKRPGTKGSQEQAGTVDRSHISVNPTLMACGRDSGVYRGVVETSERKRDSLDRGIRYGSGSKNVTVAKPLATHLARSSEMLLHLVTKLRSVVSVGSYRYQSGSENRRV